MWQLAAIEKHQSTPHYHATLPAIRFSDGNPISHLRGGAHVSVRLIIQGCGYIDFTDAPVSSPDDTAGILGHIDLNGSQTSYSISLAKMKLVLEEGNRFSFALIDRPRSTRQMHTLNGLIKPLVLVPAATVSFFSGMIKDGHTPYPQPPWRSKSPDTIQALGRQFFPFSDCSFELAMAAYDATTPSFVRLVLFSMFEYVTLWTFLLYDPLRLTFVASPFHVVVGQSSKGSGSLDLKSIAAAIFAANWGPYTPHHAEYMKSFLMHPADSEEEVLDQLQIVYRQLQQFSNVTNHLLWAAMMSMPRTSLHPWQFGAQFVEFPGNARPHEPLGIKLEQALTTFLRPGSILTTKQAWSFGNSLDIAMHYQNGIILIAHPPRDSTSLVWDVPAYTTDLSNQSDKIEWVFPVMSSFRILSVQSEMIHGRKVYIFHLESLTRRPLSDTLSVANSQDQTEPRSDLPMGVNSIDFETILAGAESSSLGMRSLEDESAIPSSLKPESWAREGSLDDFGTLKASLPGLPPDWRLNAPMRKFQESELTYGTHGEDDRWCRCM